MKNKYVALKLVCLIFVSFIASGFVMADTIAIHNVGHGSLYFGYKKLIIHVDPYSAQADYGTLPDASLIFITHGHSDHYDLNALGKIKTDSTELVCTQAVKNLGTYTGTTHVLNNGDSMQIKGISVKAVPAYNVSSSWHAKGIGNGYIFTFGEKRVYVAGDTENIPEMGNLGKIDIAFLPMNLPYTMTVAAAAEAAKKINPDILYIYHFGNSDTASLRNMLSNEDMIIRMGKSVFYENDKREVTSNSIIPVIENSPFFYPNPARDYLTVENLNGGSSLSMYSLTGQLLLKNYQQKEGEHRIDLKSLIPGIYIMKYQDKQLIKSSVILKE
jgi:L-ascorbate metabolism protein UlaG (beta-lactamase superfamily)